MSTTVDVLVTEYKMKTADYEAGASRVQAATAGLGRAAGLAGQAFEIAKPLLIGAGGALVGLSVMASQAASEFEVLQQSLIVVTGSAERAADVFAFVQRQAAPSAFFGVRELGEAAKLLETFRLRAEEFLPIANTMASLFGQNAESLNSFVMALGRIRAGNFGEGFERLREMGVTRDMLEAEGLRFNASNQFQGNADQALQAIRRAVERNFGGIDEAMAGTMSATMATFGDMVQQSLAAIGEPLNEALGPVIAGLAESMADPEVRDALTGLGETLGETAVQMAAMAPTVEDLASSFSAMAVALPGVIEGLQSIGNFFGSVFGALQSAYNAVIDATGTGMLPGGERIPRSDMSDTSITPEQEAQLAEIQRGFAEREAARADQAKQSATIQTQVQAETLSAITRQTTVLESIATNTKAQLDISRMAFGFGAGTAGITAVELSDSRRRRAGGRIGVILENLVEAIQSEAFAATVDQARTRRGFA